MTYGAPEADSRTHPVRRALVVAALIALAAFWIWALFFASKSAINKVEDRRWAAQAEATCAEVRIQLRALDAQTSTDLDERAALVEQSTDLLAAMLDEITVEMPADEKGQAIVPAWVDDYRILLADRYRYAEMLRSGQDGPFTETAVDNVPITERLETFAGDNEMASCAPPRGSVL
jgi:acyl-CoA reductase-like NAD-dependent aldehyde dehydrogenase